MEFVREAGFGILLVMAFGGASLVVSFRYALAPKRELLALVVGFATLTLLAGLIGAVTGIQRSASGYATATPPVSTLFLVGLRESLNNVVASLVIVSLDAMLATAGAYRRARALGSREQQRALAATG
jgi:hypothetical protein